jgi:hypothetical protein
MRYKKDIDDHRKKKGQAKCTPTFYFMHSNLEWKSVHSNFFGGKLSTPIYLEWTTFHSKIFHYLGVNNHALKAHSKNLECT